MCDLLKNFQFESPGKCPISVTDKSQRQAGAQSQSQRVASLISGLENPLTKAKNCTISHHQRLRSFVFVFFSLFFFATPTDIYLDYVQQPPPPVLHVQNTSHNSCNKLRAPQLMPGEKVWFTLPGTVCKVPKCCLPLGGSSCEFIELAEIISARSMCSKNANLESKNKMIQRTFHHSISRAAFRL